MSVTTVDRIKLGNKVKYMSMTHIINQDWAQHLEQNNGRLNRKQPHRSPDLSHTTQVLPTYLYLLPVYFYSHTSFLINDE